MPDGEEVRWERLLPLEYQRRVEALPVVFLPLGTVEWHGLHNALGLDSLKAHSLCVRAAQKAGGGIVHPPLYGGMGGLDKPATVVMEPEHTWDRKLLRPWLEQLCREFHRQGFRAIAMLTGHYGHNQQIVVRQTAVDMSERLNIPVLGTPEYWLAHDAGYTGDHAGVGETSLMMHLYPGLVAIDRFQPDADYGATEAIPEGSSAALGKKYADLIVDRLSRVARAMPSWGQSTRAAFVRAERALVDAQIRRWRDESAWAAWKKIFSGELPYYGQYLADQQFDRIEHMAAQLLD